MLSSKYPRNTGDSEYEEKWRVFGIAYMVKKGDSHEWVRAMADEEEDEEEEYSFRMAMEGLGIIAVVGIVLAYLISSYYERWTFTNCMIWVGISLLITWASSAEKLGMNVFHYPISKRMIRIGYSVVLALTIFISLPRVSDWVPQFIEDCLGFACFIGTGVFLGTFLWTKEDDDESKPVYYVRVDHSDPSTSTDEL